MEVLLFVVGIACLVAARRLAEPTLRIVGFVALGGSLILFIFGGLAGYQMGQARRALEQAEREY